MKNVTEDKIIGSFAVLGMATLLSAIIFATMKWVDPFLSNDINGNPTILGRLFVYGIYFVESLAILLVLWLVCLAVWSFIPRRRTKTRHIRNIPLKAAQNITGHTHGIN